MIVYVTYNHHTGSVGLKRSDITKFVDTGIQYVIRVKSRRELGLSVALSACVCEEKERKERPGRRPRGRPRWITSRRWGRRTGSL